LHNFTNDVTDLDPIADTIHTAIDQHIPGKNVGDR